MCDSDGDDGEGDVGYDGGESGDGEGSSGEGGSGEVEGKDLRRMDRGVCFVAGVGGRPRVECDDGEAELE